MVKSEEILGCDRYILERGATIEDVFVVWIMLAWMLAVASIRFAIENLNKTSRFGFCS